MSAEIGELLVHPVSRNIWSEQELTDIAFNDSEWETVGLPHCFNELPENVVGGEKHGIERKYFLKKKIKTKKYFLNLKV